MSGVVITCIVAAAIGFVVGIFSGLLGIGGGSVTLPIFRLGFGMSAVASTATSLFTIIPTSISGTISHVRMKTCVPKLGIALGVGGACTSPLGVTLAQYSPSWAVMFAAALVVGYSSITMLRKALQTLKTPKAAKDSSEKPAAPEPSIEQPSLSKADLAKAVLIGTITGVASGYVGLGGGFLMVPLMLSLLHMPMKLVSGTSLIAVMILATPATIMQCMLGNVDYVVGIALACGSIPGAAIGARLTSRVPERALRFGFAGFLGLAAVLLVVREFGAWG